MLFLLDTNAISDLMREHPAMAARLSTAPASDRVITCTIVRGEILHGLARLPAGKRRDAIEAKATALFAAIPCEPIPQAAAEHYARIKITQQQQGLSLDENDLWIAATASALGATLISRDIDFRRIQGFPALDWTV